MECYIQAYNRKLFKALPRQLFATPFDLWMNYFYIPVDVERMLVETPHKTPQHTHAQMLAGVCNLVFSPSFIICEKQK